MTSPYPRLSTSPCPTPPAPCPLAIPCPNHRISPRPSPAFACSQIRVFKAASVPRAPSPVCGTAERRTWTAEGLGWSPPVPAVGLARPAPSPATAPWALDVVSSARVSVRQAVSCCVVGVRLFVLTWEYFHGNRPVFFARPDIGPARVLPCAVAPTRHDPGDHRPLCSACGWLLVTRW